MRSDLNQNVSKLPNFILAIEEQCLTVDESRVYQPPSVLQLPDTPVSNSDSALSAPDSDSGSSSEEEYKQEVVESVEEPEVKQRAPPLGRLKQVWLDLSHCIDKVTVKKNSVRIYSKKKAHISMMGMSMV